MVKPNQEISEPNTYLDLINSFSIQTQGKANVWLPEKLKIDSMEGSLSDSTYINLPITSLRKLIK